MSGGDLERGRSSTEDPDPQPQSGRRPVLLASAALVLAATAARPWFRQKLGAVRWDSWWAPGTAVLIVAAVAVRGSRRSIRRRSKEPPRTVNVSVAQEQPAEPKACAREEHVRHVNFNPRVSCMKVSDLTDLPDSAKAEFWWRQSDFEEFLQIRVEIGKAYRTAAKKLGLNIMDVSPLGAHGDEAYRAMLEINPKLRGESRRGLGLGRKRQRAQNRDAYIAAVLDEQERQRRLARDTQIEFPRLDTNALGKVASRVSEKDTRYAAWLAMRYYQEDREVEQNEERERELRRAEGKADRAAAAAALNESPEEDAAFRTALATPRRSTDGMAASTDEVDVRGMVRSASFCLSGESAAEAPGAEGQPSLDPFQRQASPADRHLTKGFGLSRDRLRQVGLSATGHSLSRLHKLKRRAVDDTESEGTACETEEEEDADADADVEDDSAAKIAEYRQWRMGAPVRSGMPGHTAAKTYGTRREYRAWRAWQPTSPKDSARESACE